VLPATRQRWHSRPYPSRSWYSIKRPRRDARLSWPSVGGRHSIACMAEGPRRGWGSWGKTRRAPSPPARGLRERCKLPQWGPGQSPGRNRFWFISKLVEGIKSKRCVSCFCVSNFSLKHPKHPLVTALGAAEGLRNWGGTEDIGP